jgi:ATP-binding cassette, subfamily B, multidrug efflux pump
MLRPRHSTPLTMGQKRKAKDNIGTLKRLWSFVSPQKGWLLATVIMVIISSGLSLLGPYVVGKAIDMYIVERRTDDFWLVLALLLFIYVTLSASTFLQNYWMIGVAQKTVYAIRKQLFRHFHELPISFFDKRQQGELMSRITNDIDNMSQTFNSTAIQVISSMLTLAGAIGVMVCRCLRW